MRTSNFPLLARSRLRPLAACLALALSGQLFAGARADNHTVVQPSVTAGYGWGPEERSPDHTNAQIRVVQNCTDHDPDSLRDIIENPNGPNYAQIGDIVDLSQLPTLCGMAHAAITLTTGEITIQNQDLQLRGVALNRDTVTISGGGASRVFNNIASSGTLSIYAVTIADGYYHHATNAAAGGCIESAGNIFLHSVTVTGCKASSDADYARGGGIHAGGDVTLAFSTVSGNEAFAPTRRAFGGGVYGNNVYAKYSSIAANMAHNSSYMDTSTGGGTKAIASVSIRGSTISDNTAGWGSALSSASASSIYNSTISGNVALIESAVRVMPATSLTIANSTIAFNHSEADMPAAGAAIDFYGATANSTLTLQSSIIANNTAGAGNTPSDVYVKPGFGILSGADNLVIASNVSDPSVITVTTDPQLGPLQFNGGSTKTHALLRNSPALTRGNNNAGLLVDQRGTGYPRTTGPNAEVDIGAFEFDSIFAAGFDN